MASILKAVEEVLVAELRKVMCYELVNQLGNWISNK